MLELIILGGLGYVISWYKGTKFAIWVGIAIIIAMCLALLAFLAVVVGPLSEEQFLYEVLGGAFGFLLEGSLAVWLTLMGICFVVGCYGAGIALAQIVKRRKGLNV